MTRETGGLRFEFGSQPPWVRPAGSGTAPAARHLGFSTEFAPVRELIERVSASPSGARVPASHQRADWVTIARDRARDAHRRESCSSELVGSGARTNRGSWSPWSG